jgi:DNA-binding NarL/FixJ family response regulator
VLTLIARGHTNAEIAALLFGAESTSKTHVARILTKLRLNDRAQAVIAAYETGLIRPGTPRPRGSAEPTAGPATSA